MSQRKKLLPKSIKSRLTFITVSFSLLLSMTVTSICYGVFQGFLKKNLLQSTEFNLQLISRAFTSELENTINLGEWCTGNLLIRTYLEKASDPSSKPLSLEAYERLKEEYQAAKSTAYINRLIITDPMGNFLQIANVTSQALTSDGALLISQDFYREAQKNDTLYFPGIVTDPFSKYTKQQVLPILLPVTSYYSSNIVGWTYLSISTSIITDALENYALPEDSILYLTIGEQSYQIENKELKLLSEDTEPSGQAQEVKAIEEESFHNTGTRLYEVVSKDNNKKSIVVFPSSMEDIYLSQSVSQQQLTTQRGIYYGLLVLIFFLVWALGLFLMVYTNHIINEPIRFIQKKLNRISEGDFSRDTGIEWDHELGDIGRGINKISHDIVVLMDKRIADEQQKKDLEYQMLQSQIDPHFIYNTLNSIKWMATIQNATGIAEMTTSLARLLKTVSKGTAGLVTIKEELSLIEDYFLIQKYRYGGTITMEYHVDEELNDCLLPRFTLQPLVENALFHGLEPKGYGTITITITHPDEALVQIDVTDNGIGMSSEQIEKVFAGESTGGSKFFKQLGIHNVNRRIQYEFGEAYGIHISSVPDEYTTMTIELPYKTETIQQE